MTQYNYSPGESTSHSHQPAPKPSPWAGVIRFFLVGGFVLLGLFLMGSLFAGSLLGHLTQNFEGMSRVNVTTIQGEGEVTMAVINLEGTISSQGRMTGEISPESVKVLTEAALNFPSLKILLIDMNSPGGEVTASDRIHHLLKTIRPDVKIITLMGDLGASGAYYIACAGEKIYARPTSVVGSIGVISQSVNIHGLLEQHGVEVAQITSGEHKGGGSIFSDPETEAAEESRKIMKSIVTSMHSRFIDIVAEGRPALTRERIESLATGRVFIAREALDEGLLDGIAYRDDLIDELIESSSSGAGQVKGRVVNLALREPTLMDVLMGPQSSHSPVSRWAEAWARPRLQFLCPPLKVH